MCSIYKIPENISEYEEIVITNMGTGIIYNFGGIFLHGGKYGIHHVICECCVHTGGEFFSHCCMWQDGPDTRVREVFWRHSD